MANWYQKGRDGNDVAVGHGRTVGLFGVMKISGYRESRYQIDHLQSGFKVAEVRGWDYGMHWRLARELQQVIDSRNYGDHNPWFFKSKPGPATLEVMRADLNEARERVMAS